jgi:NAD(P)H-hydrate epimerase
MDSHKGTFGTVLIAAGSANYTGAALLAGKAAYLSGAGLVTIAVPSSIHQIIAGQLLEATWLLLPDEMGVFAEDGAEILSNNMKRVTSILVGPGLGMEMPTRNFLSRLFHMEKKGNRSGIGFLRSDSSGQLASATLPPLVLDADGLKLISQFDHWHESIPQSSVLTPHPGEMSIMTGQDKDQIQANRLATAEHFSREWGHIVILKGAFTVIASPQGETAVIPIATPALARAGTGDVLAGLVAGLLAQGMDPFHSSVSGAWIHARAGLLAESVFGISASVLAGDVLNAVPKVLATIEKVK